MKRKQLTSLILLAAVLTTAACGSTPSDSPETTTASDDTETSTSAEPVEYQYPDKDYGGREFTVMNYDSMWDCVMALDFAEQNGDRLDDAIYNRNRKVEEKLGFKMNEVTQHYIGWFEAGNSTDLLMSNIMAGDTTYDAAYIPVTFKPAVVTDGYLYDLYKLPGMNLTEDWWDQVMVDTLTINGQLYAVTSPLHLMSLDMSWVMLFNQDMLDERKLEYPYQLVRDGKWTLDKWQEYVTAVASLNGDESFTYSKSGNAIYGISHHPTAIEGMIYSAGNKLIKEENGGYKLDLQNEHLYTTLEKCFKLLDRTNGNRTGDTMSANEDYYYNIFRDERAVFLTCELKTANVMRDMKATFGLLPYPKYDENQESYYTMMSASSCVLTVPNNIKDPEFTGTVLDALSYESLQTVLPEYYDVSLSQKGLRNDDSIEMLQIIRSTRGVEFARVFGITSDILLEFRNLADSGSENYVSVIASNLSSIEQNLNSFLKSFE